MRSTAVAAEVVGKRWMSMDLLNGLRVVESSAFVAAPLAGLTLAQLGAEVIRIDLIGGGIDYQRMPRSAVGRSLYWTGLNKGKRSVAIDFRRPEGRELVRELVVAGERGGILLTNVGSSWLAHSDLAQLRPDLISCTIEGNGDGTSAVDYTVNCATGLPFLTGPARADLPVNHVLPAWDVACAHQAATAIVAAAMRRQLSGQGAELRLSLSDVAFSTLSHLGMLAEAELTGVERPADGNYLFGAFGRDFATRDGHRVYVVGLSARQWRSLLAATGLESEFAAVAERLSLDFGREEHRFEGRAAIAAALEPWFGDRPLSEVSQALDAAGATWGRYQTMTQALRDDWRVSSRNPVFERIGTEGVGEHLAAGSALRAQGEQRGRTVPAPLLGADTEQVLAEILGLSDSEIGRLIDRGIVANATADPLTPRPPHGLAALDHGEAHTHREGRVGHG